MRTLTRWEPVSDLATWNQQMDRWFNELMNRGVRRVVGDRFVIRTHNLDLHGRLMGASLSIFDGVSEEVRCRFALRQMFKVSIWVIGEPAARNITRLSLTGQRTAAEGAGAWNPVFDVTPAELVDAIVTERGVIERPDQHKIARHLAGGSG